jgi:histidinol-phosphate aminotransferase
MTDPRLRAVLERLPAYVAGRPPGAAPSGVRPYKLSSNENPFPPLPGVVEAARDAAGDLNRYPPPTAIALERALAARFGVDPAQVVVGAGSVGLLQQLVAAAAGDGDEVVYAWRSFEAYPIVIAVGGAVGVPVPLTHDGRHDLDAMAAAVTEGTRIVLLCTPNNPTGPALGAAEVEHLLDRLPPDLLVVIDEAYVEFVRDPAAVAGLEVLARRPNVLVLRTFSKAYGLAGLRVGYAVAAPAVAAALRRVTVPFTVSAVSEAAALAALDAFEALDGQVAQIVAERDRVLGSLRGLDLGFEIPDAQGNFVWLPTGERTAEFTAACEQQAVSVRPFGSEGVRITIGEPEANDRVLKVAANF